MLSGVATVPWISHALPRGWRPMRRVWAAVSPLRAAAPSVLTTRVRARQQQRGGELHVILSPAMAEDPAARKAAVEFLRALLAQPGKR